MLIFFFIYSIVTVIFSFFKKRKLILEIYIKKSLLLRTKAGDFFFSPVKLLINNLFTRNVVLTAPDGAFYLIFYLFFLSGQLMKHIFISV